MILIKTLQVRMKLTVIILIAACLQVNAKGFTQNITLTLNNSSLEKAFQEIEKQTGFSFIYLKENLKETKHVDLTVKNGTLEKILDLLFFNQPLTYTISGKYVVVKEKIVRPSKIVTNEPPPLIDVNGRVVDENGDPFEGVSVQIKGTNRGTTTDKNGLFILTSVDVNATLVFTSVNIESLELKVNGKSNLLVKAKTKVFEGEVVVITGFGEVKRKKDITGAVSSVRAKDIEALPITSFDRAIQGRMAGVMVNGISGIPGGAVQVRIRGVSSINAGSAPLYIIDGVQVESGNLSQNYSSNVLSTINPDDIESIDVLKDPATASIYGAQAANGVVIITTKRGKSGKTKISFKTQTGMSQVIRKMDVLTGPEIAQLSLEAIANRDGTSSTRYRNFLNNVLKGDPLSYPNYDWQDAVFINGILQEYQLSLSGGNENTKFFLSGGYNKTKGHVINSDFSRANFRFNLDHTVTEKLKIQTSLGASSVTSNGVNGAGRFDNPNRTAFMMWPGNPIYNADGSFANFRNYIGTLDNVLATTAYDVNKTGIKKFFGNLSATYNITKHLTFRSAYNLDYTNSNEIRFIDPRTRRGSGIGYAENYNGERVDWQTDQTLNYSKAFNTQHSFSALAGVQYRHYTRNTTEARGENVPSSLLNNLGATGLPTSAVSTYTTWKLAGIFSKLNYTFRNTYILTATLRYDGSSRFGKNVQYGLFPAFSGAWKISEEKFIQNSKWISDLKLRAGYGITGNNDIGNFEARSLYGISGNYLGLTGLALTQIGNPHLSWEENKSVNIGLDYGLFNRRITGSVEYFVSNRNKLLFDLPIPSTNGLGSYRTNIGSLQNKGIELEITTKNFNAKSFKWITSANISFVKNKITSLPLLGTKGINFGNRWAFAGYAFEQIYVPEYAGVNPSDGRPQWYNYSKSITYTPSDSDRVMAGSRIPTWFGGFTNTITYKNFELRIFFQFSGGNKILNDDARLMSNSGSDLNRNQFRSQLNRWQKPGDVTDVPKPFRGGSIGGASAGNIYSTRFVEDGSYARLKDLSLAYQFPNTITQKLSLQSARFFITAVNIWTKTSYTGFDPELVAVEDEGIYPQGKSFIVGLQVNF